MTRRPWLARLVLLATLPVLPATAAVLPVAPDGHGPHATIQAALDAASNGDVVELADGVYTGEGNRDLDFRGKAVTLRARGADPARCVLDCSGDDWRAPHRAFVFRSGEGPATRVSGLTVRHGQATAPRPPAGSGGALLCSGASPVLSDCVFTACRATTGGAAACEAGAAPRFERCDFRGNTATFGGALQAFQASPVLVECRFTANTAGSGGGAAFFAGATRLERCVFARNSATMGGALAVEKDANLELTRCEFADNVATLGGAVFVNAAAPRLTGCRFAGNSAGAGAGLCLRGAARLVLAECEITDSAQGAAADCDAGSSLQATHCRIAGNGDGDWTGCLAGQPAAGAAVVNPR